VFAIGIAIPLIVLNNFHLFISGEDTEFVRTIRHILVESSRVFGRNEIANRGLLFIVDVGLDNPVARKLHLKIEEWSRLLEIESDLIIANFLNTDAIKGKIGGLRLNKSKRQTSPVGVCINNSRRIEVRIDGNAHSESVGQHVRPSGAIGRESGLIRAQIDILRDGRSAPSGSIAQNVFNIGDAGAITIVVIEAVEWILLIDPREANIGGTVEIVIASCDGCNIAIAIKIAGIKGTASFIACLRVAEDNIAIVPRRSAEVRHLRIEETIHRIDIGLSINGSAIFPNSILVEVN